MYVVITGASRGIGKALTYKFASKGYDLIITCEKNEQMLLDVKKDIEDKYKRKVFTKIGLITDSDLQDFEKNCNTKICENIYILINNAGKCDYNFINDVSYEKYREIVYSNLDYTFLTSKNIFPYLIKNKQGIVVNITSMWGILGASCESIYSMTKAGLIGFTKAWAKEMKYAGVDVIAFALGAVNTDMCKQLSPLCKSEEEFRKGIETFVKTLDGGKMFEPEEIADRIYECILFKKYETGEIIEINNGLK